VVKPKFLLGICNIVSHAWFTGLNRLGAIKELFVDLALLRYRSVIIIYIT